MDNIKTKTPLFSVLGLVWDEIDVLEYSKVLKIPSVTFQFFLGIFSCAL